MHVLELWCDRPEKDLLVTRLWELDTAGIQEEELPEFRWRLQAFFDAPFDAAEFASYGAKWANCSETDWTAVSRRSWHPVEAGRRFWLVPEWDHTPAPPGRLRLVSHPGMASGSGYQPPTLLAIEALEETSLPGDTLLDVGTGSGILAQAAYLLGVRRILACDIDVQSAWIASSNLRADCISAFVFAGSPRSLRSGCASLLAANLNAWALRLSAAELARVAAPRARIVASGFRQHSEKAVTQTFARLGFRPLARRSRDGWMCITLER